MLRHSYLSFFYTYYIIAYADESFVDPIGGTAGLRRIRNLGVRSLVAKGGDDGGSDV
jgi:hypothetical protein